MTDYNDGRPPVSVAELREHFSYDEHTGIIRSKTNRRNVHAGEIVGTPDRQGYIVTTLFKRPLKQHRMAWAMTHGAWPAGMIDHINGDKQDNRIENLRVVSNAQNKQNVSKPANNTSGFMGVSFHKPSGKWVANIKVDGKAHYLGLHEAPSDAHAAYLSAKATLHPYSNAGAK